MAPSRADRLMQSMGGVENLPTRSAPVQTAPQPEPPEDDGPMSGATAARHTASSADSYQNVAGPGETFYKPGEDYWNATPRKYVVPHIEAKKANTDPFNFPITSASGEVTFKFDTRRGETAPLGINFCPFIAVTKFCYKFVPRHLAQPLATAFFDDSKIWERDWDLFYIWSPHYETARPITFIPEHQLLELIGEINQAFPDENVKIPDSARDDWLVISFDDLPQGLRPRWVGHSTSRAQIEYWTDNLTFPSSTCDMADNDRSLEAFKAKIENALAVSKNKSKAAKTAKHQENVVKRQDMTKQYLRAQRFLGLLASREESLMPEIAKLSISPLDPEKPVPGPFENDVVFVAVDLEAFERGSRPVTEVGIATLDTRDLQAHHPGNNGENWHKLIRARHFRIIEHKHLVNQDFVTGCPNNFEFGSSEFIPKASIIKAIAECFKEPFSRAATPADRADTPAPDEPEPRNIVLLGHDTMQDINYLRSIGFNPLDRANLREVMDTAAMFRGYTHDPNARSLGSMLYHFDLVGWHLHNAGNDAVYAVWAMLAMCVQGAVERGGDGAAKRHEEVAEKRVEAAVEMARVRVERDGEGWDVDEDGDGGVALPGVSVGDASDPLDTTGRGTNGFRTAGGALLDV